MSEYQTIMDAIGAQWAAANARHEQTITRMRRAVFDSLAATAVVSVTVTFDGYGDSGQIDAIEATDATGAAASLDGNVTCDVVGDDETVSSETRTLADAIETVCYGLLELRHPGWEINDGAFGDFTFNVAARSIELECNTRYTDHNTEIFTFTEVP